MAIITDSSTCGICNNPVSRGDLVAVRPFTRNRQDPLFPFSGRIFHQQCLEAHPLFPQIESASKGRAERMNAGSHVCTVCGQAIVGGEGRTTDLMSVDPAHPLFEYNYLFFHTEHVKDWTGLQEFEEAVCRASELGVWEGPLLVSFLT